MEDLICSFLKVDPKIYDIFIIYIYVFNMKYYIFMIPRIPSIPISHFGPRRPQLNS